MHNNPGTPASSVQINNYVFFGASCTSEGSSVASCQPAAEAIIAEYVEDAAEIRSIADRLRNARSRGELGITIAREVLTYSLFELQVIGGRLNNEIEKLPSPYRERIRPYFTEQLFGMHHRLLAEYYSGAFFRMTAPLQDRAAFNGFCDMLPVGCFTFDDPSECNPHFRQPRNRLFYYLIAAYTMFILELPGHPVGMPFPGGSKVEERNGEYFCLIRDKEKEVPFSICNFCPAKQSEEKKVT